MLIEDKGRLLAAIEAAYGAHEPFNVLMHNILVSASKAHAGASGALEVCRLEWMDGRYRPLTVTVIER